MNKLFKVFAGTILTFVSVFCFVQAVKAEMPEVYVQNLIFSGEVNAGDTVKGSFELLNTRNDDVTNVFTKIALIKVSKDGEIRILDQIVQGPFNVEGGKTKKVTFSYVLPPAYAGKDFNIGVFAMTQTDLPLGFQYLKISIKGTLSYADVISGFVYVDDNKFEREDGPTVAEGQKVKYAMTLKNVGKKILSFTPVVSLYKRSAMSSDPVSTFEADAVSIPAGVTQKVTIDMPIFDLPDVYVGTVNFLDSEKNRVAPVSIFRYIIAGDVAAIQSVTSDKKTLDIGNDLKLSFVVSGSPSDIFTKSIKEVGKVTFQANILNERGELVSAFSKEIEMSGDNAGGINETVAGKALVAAQAMSVDASVVKNGKVLSRYVANLSSDYNIKASEAMLLDAEASAKAERNRMIAYVIGGLSVVLLIVALVMKQNAEKKVGNSELVSNSTPTKTYTPSNNTSQSSASVARKNPPMGPIAALLIMIASGLFFGLGATEVRAFTLGAECSANGIWATINAPITNGLMHPGQRFNVTGSVSSMTTGGTTANNIMVSAVLDGRTVGTGITRTSGSVGEIKYFTIPTVLIAPQTVGDYNISISFSSGGKTCSGVQPITVVETHPTPSLAANYGVVSYHVGDNLISESDTLVWNSELADTCQGSGFSTGGATSGSVVVRDMTQDTTYGVRCNSYLGWSQWANVVVKVPPPATNLTHSCNLQTNQATVSWGLPSPYTYSYPRISEQAYMLMPEHQNANPTCGTATSVPPYTNGKYNKYCPTTPQNITSYTFNITPNVAYAWAVHSSDGPTPAHRGAFGVATPLHGMAFTCRLPTATLTATPTTVDYGGTALLRWSSTDATTCISPDFDTQNAPANQVGVPVTLTATRTFNLSCLGSSVSTNAVPVTVTVNPPSPTLLAPVLSGSTGTCSQTPNGGRLNLNWTSVSGADGYELYKNGAVFGTFESSITAFTISNEVPGTQSSYSIKAFRNGSPKVYSVFSNVVQVTASPMCGVNVSLSANPSRGEAPLTSRLTATVQWAKKDSGSQTAAVAYAAGNRYQFKCKTGDPAWSAWNASNEYDCTYSTAGTYTAGVNVDRNDDNIVDANDDVTIVVDPPQDTEENPIGNHEMMPFVMGGECYTTVQWERFPPSYTDVSYEVWRTSPGLVQICPTIPASDTTTSSCIDDENVGEMTNGATYTYQVKAIQDSRIQIDTATNSYVMAGCEIPVNACPALPDGPGGVGRILEEGESVTYYQYPSRTASDPCSAHKQTAICSAGNLTFLPTGSWQTWSAYFNRCITGQEQ